MGILWWGEEEEKERSLGNLGESRERRKGRGGERLGITDTVDPKWRREKEGWVFVMGVLLCFIRCLFVSGNEAVYECSSFMT